MSNKFTAIKRSESAGSKAQVRKATPQEWYAFHLATNVLALAELVPVKKVQDLFDIIQKAEYNRVMVGDRKDIPVYTELALQVLQDEVNLNNENGYPDIRVFVEYIDSSDTDEEE